MGLTWRTKLSVGNDLIDADHQHLIFIINKADSALTELDTGKLKQVLAELSTYARRHFVREEAIAHAIAYPHAGLLHSSHEHLTCALDLQHATLMENCTEESAKRFMAFLKTWLVDHVIKEDMQMKPWLLNYPAKFDPTRLAA